MAKITNNLFPLICFCLLAPMFVMGAEDSPDEAQVLGWVEKAIVIPLGVTVKVKLDSGALTSSMDARNIEIYKKDGRKWVRFRLHLKDENSEEEFYRDMDMPVKRLVLLRGAGGMDRRPVVVLPLCIGNRVYEEQFTLRDRDDMLYPVLLGRRTIEDLGILDVRRTFVTQPSCNLEQEIEAGAAIPAATK
jgi:hypothetical protein